MRDYLTSEPKPYAVSSQFHPDRCEYVFVGKITRPMDDAAIRWGVVFGDVLHNFRSALDHLVWQLVLLNTGKDGSGENQFPICSNGASYWSISKRGDPSTRERRLRGVSDEHKAIIDGLQPYRTDNLAASRIEAPAGLRDFSNHDKHRLVHPTLFAVDAVDADDFSLQSNTDAGGIISQRMEPLREDRETEILCATFECPGPNPSVGVRGELPVRVGFGKPPVRLPAFFTLAELIASIIERFAPAFP